MKCAIKRAMHSKTRRAIRNKGISKNSLIFIYIYISQKYTSQPLPWLQLEDASHQRNYTDVTKDQIRNKTHTQRNISSQATLMVYVYRSDRVRVIPQLSTSLPPTAIPLKQVVDPSLDVLEAVPDTPIRVLPHITKRVHSSDEVAVSWR